MTYLIGVDEAGYGPNLGPLVVAATVWQLPDALEVETLADAVADFLSAEPGEHHERLVVGDSKVLYQAGGGLQRLEAAVLGAAALLQLPCGTWRRLLAALLGESPAALAEDPCYADYDADLPRDLPCTDVLQAALQWHHLSRHTGVRLVAMRVAAVFPGDWNQRLDAYGGKGELLSRATLELVRQCSQPLPDSRIVVHCDKHGGRNRYGPLLQQVFPDYLVEVRQESRAVSRYTWGPPQRRLEWRFAAGGECCPASALSSMLAKYLRELAMQAFNSYWRNLLPELRPTAGYPTDAGRFWKETSQLRKRLKLRDELLWRRK